jgi:hypothetical protein
MEQLLFLALLGVIGLLRWFSQMAEERRNREAEKRTAAPPPNAPVPRAPAVTEEERIRRFMEALGVPTDAPIPKVPPKLEAPKPTRPAAPPKRAGMPIDPFPRPGGGVPTPPVVVAPPPPRSAAPAAPPPLVPPPPSAAPPLPTRETTVFAEPPRPRPARRAEGAEFEVRDIADGAYEVAEPVGSGGSREADRAAAPLTGIAARLATRQGLRDAVVLREIFGPPRSMQPLNLTRD